MKIIARSWAENRNIAFVAKDDLPRAIYDVGEEKAIKIEQNQPYLRVIQANTNRIRLNTQLPTKKFLVFNDCYYPQWRAYINGQETFLYRANVAFKGIWVPPGEHNIEFVFGDTRVYQREIFIMIFYFAFFVLFLWFWRKDSWIEDKPDV